jgi:hypothetical protein
MSERDYLVSKAWRGESGDKRNTKYYASYGAGALTASGIAGAVPVNRRIMRVGNARGAHALTDHVSRAPEDLAGGIRAATNAKRSTPGFKRMIATRAGAGVAGGAAGVTAYAAYRRNKKKV